jgi:hypothetical protein
MSASGGKASDSQTYLASSVDDITVVLGSLIVDAFRKGAFDGRVI